MLVPDSIYVVEGGKNKNKKVPKDYHTRDVNTVPIVMWQVTLEVNLEVMLWLLKRCILLI